MNAHTVTEPAPDPRSTKHYEGAFTLGSGYLHVRGSHEEGLAAAPQDESYTRLPANVTLEQPRHPRSKAGTYVPGVTGLHPLLRQELVNLPSFLDIRVTADGERLDMDTAHLEGYERTLDLRTAILTRTFRWRTRAGALLEARYTRYVSRARAALSVQVIHYRCLEGDARIEMESGIDARVKTNGYDHYVSVTCGAEGDGVRVAVRTDTGDTVAIAARTICDRAGFRPAPGVDRRPVTSAVFTLAAGSAVEVLKLSAVATSRDLDAGDTSPETRARQTVDAALGDRAALEREHTETWAAMWNDCDITIEGDPGSDHAVRYALYHLLRAANPDDNRVAVCAKGAAGEAYFGHFFWDTEIYLLPFYLYTRPDTARALVEFRLRTLAGAQRNAAAYGYTGARYPWESSVTGDEQCPNWQYADFEVHITADVVHAIRHYEAVTGDATLTARARELLIETSRYWASRVYLAEGGGTSLNGVMGPDEYTCFSNNNAYTNEMVKRALRFSLTTLERAPADTEVGAPERALWARIAAELPVTTRPDGVILQCDHFEELERVDLDTLWKDRGAPFGHFISQERNYRTQALKQADALMLPYLFPADYPREVLEATYDYYAPVTTHDSSLSCVVHSILAARLGRIDEAAGLFRRALGIDIDPDVGGAAEGIHIANCGGIWQAVVLGFAGMSWGYESDEPRFTPRLPRGWSSITFPLVHRGARRRMRVTASGAERCS